MSGLRSSNLSDYWRWLRRRYKRYRVTGRSMLPTLPPESEILYDPDAFAQETPRVNEVVIARHPGKNILIIKRITDVLPDGRLILSGDNRAESNDSRAFGPVHAGIILGKVISSFP